MDALERFLLHKKGALKETAAAVQTAALPASAPAQEHRASALPSAPADAMYPGRRTHPPQRAWLERAEAESQRRHAARVACYQRIQAFAAVGADQADIARLVGVSRQTVHR